jgi:phage terminase large subunit
LGEWGVVGNTIFNKEKVSERLSEIRELKHKQGYFIYEYQNEKIVDDTIKWIESGDGYIEIIEDVKKRYPYVVGGDTAGDKTTGNSDYFTAQVLDNTTGIQVATLRNKFDEDLYAKQMYCLGYYYNKALLAIEVNYSTYPVKELERLGYWEQFTRQEEDNFTHKFEKRHGFKTTKLTRPLVIAQLVEIVREHTYLFNDVETLEEMLTFVRNESGRPEAQLGSHDDLIMALAIAFYSRSQKSFSVSEETEARKPKLIDQLAKQKRRNIYG